MRTKMKAGVIGVGTMGTLYARILKEMDHVELVGLVDIDEQRLSKFDAIFRVKCYDSAVDFYEAEEPDFVVVSCPDEFHAQYTIEALKRNIHVHLEKPLAATLEDCYAIKKASDESSARLNIGYILRMLPHYWYLRKNVMEGRFGDILHFYTRRNAVLNEGLRWKGKTDLATYLACHDVDVVTWITGSRVVRVYAEEVSKCLTQFSAHDSIQVLLKCDNDAIGVIECSWALPNVCGFTGDHRLELIGSKSAAFVDLQDKGLQFYDGEVGIKWVDTVYAPEVGGSLRGALRDEIETFIKSVKENKPVMCSVEEAIEVNRVVSAIKLSLKNKEVVHVKDVTQTNS